MKRSAIVLLALGSLCGVAVVGQSRTVPHRLHVEGSRVWDFGIGDRVPQPDDTLRVALISMADSTVWRGVLVRVVGPVPPDTMPAPPDTTPPPPVTPASPNVAVVVGSVGPDPDPRGRGFEVRASVEDSLGMRALGVPLTVRITGGTLTGVGDCCTRTSTPATTGVAIWGWLPAGADTVWVTSPGADPWFGVVTVAPAPAPPTGPPAPPAPPPGPLPPAGVQLTPANLIPSLGLLIAPDSATLLAAYDQRFLAHENRTQCNASTGQCVYAGYPNQLRLATAAPYPPGASNMAHHYGALRGRLQYSIRYGQLWGAAIADTTTMYGRGRDIALRYLVWSKPHGHAESPHNNTGLDDIEAIWLIEGDTAAWNHLHGSAQGYSSDPWGYERLVSSNSDPRYPAVALQAFNAAHRMGVPYRPLAGVQPSLDARPGSWKTQGDRLIGWILDGDPDYVHPQSGPMPTASPIQPNGALPARSCQGCEVYFMNAMIAREFLRWSAYVEQSARLEAAACLIVGHMADLGGILPFVSSKPVPAADLAGFYVYPAAVCWQITGEQRFYDMAWRNLQATSNSYLWSGKVFNETYSTGAQNGEAVLRGIPWR